MNDVLKEFLLKGDVRYWQRDFRSQLPKDLHANGDVKFQSRFEVLWRTLLTDRFLGKHPAGDECATAAHFLTKTSIEKRESLTLMSLARETPMWSVFTDTMAKSQLGPLKNMVAIEKLVKTFAEWNTSKKQLGMDYTVYQMLQGFIDEDSELCYPPQFISFNERLEKARSRGDGSENGVIFAHFLQSVENIELFDTDNIALEVRTSMEHLSTLRKLFTTDKGHLGNGAASLEVGDEVWVLAGASVPFLLRPVDGGYRLVGEAYIHGIMHGEVVEDALASSSVQTIAIV